MKKLLCIILLLLCLTANVSHSQSFKMFGQLLNLGHWSTDGLVFYWRGIEAVEAVDESYYGNHGTITGATWVGNRLEMGGAGYVSFSIPVDTSFTLVCKLKGTDVIWVDLFQDGPDFGIMYNAGVRLVWRGGNGFQTVATVGDTYSDFHVLAVTMASTGVVSAYFDGVFKGSVTDTAPEANHTFARMGFWNDTGGTVWEWAIFYNRTLSVSEIQQLSLNPNLPMQQPPIWLFTPPVVDGIIPIIQAHTRRRRAG